MRRNWKPGALIFVRDTTEKLEEICPPAFDALPDLDTFYSDWLKRPLPDTKEYKDLTYETTREWGRGLKGK